MISQEILPLIQQPAYMVAVALFIFGLKMMSSPATARRGNMLSAVGMLLAIVATLLGVIEFSWILIGFVIGALVGAVTARLVSMTQMPEMVALFNGFGGLASLLVGLADYHQKLDIGLVPTYDAVVISLAVLIGGVTFSGSIVAWGKLSGVMGDKAVALPGQNIISFIILAAAIASAVLFFINPAGNLWALYTVVVISLLLGVFAVNAIGGGDMPVVISLLNSYSGMAAAAAGFVTQNQMLIATGALVGASGLILTAIMCKAMNRSLINVLFSAFGSSDATTVGGKGVEGEVKSLSPQDAYYVLEAASSVVFVPGYGMAVAQAQHVVKELAGLLEENGTEVYYAIHPVAGRMPGHMNVLLAEADVPYDKLYEMDAINPIMPNMDVAVVIGANDVVNPAARHDKGSPIYGMPIIDVDKAKTVFVLKRSMAAGFAGIQNELFFYPNTRMVFGDAKQTFQALIAAFKD
ncbi:MAG TPA: NAD(P)(+) transhydrogenase (Re/Si-specific) subunit beta [Acidobacteriota bacterium]|nr:NAD(P)(+) transhydrogenase (Re/Si-specific) subunit beta [Acidobacteriota bacterium]